MSLRAYSLVWANSQRTGSERLMMLAIADFADDEGCAYPSVATLAAMCRMTTRNVNHILAALRVSGELEVKENAGPRGTNRYRITLGDPVQRGAPLKGASPHAPEAGFTPEGCFTLKPSSRTPEAGFPKPLKPASDEPSLNRNEPSVVGARAPRSPADRGSRLPEDWTLPADWRAWAVQHRPDLDPDTTAEAFADYWRAAPGAKGRKADWFATWRNWMRNQRARPGTASTAAPSATALARRDTDYNFADEVAP